ncbi:hypothetical protein [Natronomonas sp. EA1]
MNLSEFDHPSFRTAAGTVASYTLILAVMTVLLFGIPWLIFSFL